MIAVMHVVSALENASVAEIVRVAVSVVNA